MNCTWQWSSVVVPAVAPLLLLQTPAQKEEVRIAHAEYLLASGDMIKAAKRYAETAYAFEEVGTAQHLRRWLV